jgi:hypothetical protein
MQDKEVRKGWQPVHLRDSVLAAVESWWEGNSLSWEEEGLLNKLLNAADKWKGGDLQEALTAAAKLGDLQLVKLLLCVQEDSEGWEPRYLVNALVEAAGVMDKGLSELLVTTLLAASPLWSDFHLVPALKQAASSGHTKVVQKLLVTGSVWSSWDVKEALVAAAGARRQQVVRLLVDLLPNTKGWDGWEGQLQAYLAAAVTAAVKGNDGYVLRAKRVELKEELLMMLLDAGSGRWRPEDLMDGMLAAIGSQDADSCWDVLGTLLAAAEGTWEARHLALPLEHAVRQVVAYYKLEEILKACSSWSAEWLQGAVMAAVEADMDEAWCLGTLGVLLPAVDGLWQQQQLLQLLSAAVRKGHVSVFVELLKVGVVGDWSAHMLSGVLEEAAQHPAQHKRCSTTSAGKPFNPARAVAAAEPTSCLEALLQMPGLEWDAITLEGALHAAIQQDSGERVALLLHSQAGTEGQWTESWLSSLADTAEAGSSPRLAAAAALRAMD